MIAGTGSGVGKTSVATGLMARLSKRMRVQPYKVGPDFIDPMYHGIACGRCGRNLDTFMVPKGEIRGLVGRTSAGADLCVVEGVRGLYEGLSGTTDECSTAEVAKILGFPVLLVVNARSVTRSAAAAVNGFRSFDPDVDIAGVVLNNVSGGQHRAKAAEAIEKYCDVPVVGCLERDPSKAVGERRMGLESAAADGRRRVGAMAELAEGVDLDAVLAICESRPDRELPAADPFPERGARFTLGVPEDDAYCFYYRDNLDCLESSGAEVVRFSPVAGDPLPDCDAYYLGGGYPELHLDELERNTGFLEGLKAAADDGKAVVGEGGGMLTMCRTLSDGGAPRRMAGILDADARTAGRRGPMYCIASATPANRPFAGMRVRGHEFHYSDVVPRGRPEYGFALSRGNGIAGGADGLVYRNCIGSYMHQHALSAPGWAEGIAELVGRGSRGGGRTCRRPPRRRRRGRRRRPRSSSRRSRPPGAPRRRRRPRS